jgi:hypothetical protein
MADPTIYPEPQQPAAAPAFGDSIRDNNVVAHIRSLEESG